MAVRLHLSTNVFRAKVSHFVEPLDKSQLFCSRCDHSVKPMILLIKLWGIAPRVRVYSTEAVREDIVDSVDMDDIEIELSNLIEPIPQNSIVSGLGMEVSEGTVVCVHRKVDMLQDVTVIVESLDETRGLPLVGSPP